MEHLIANPIGILVVIVVAVAIFVMVSRPCGGR